MCFFLSTNSNATTTTSLIEFETFLARYATHFPSATFNKTKKLTELSIDNLCNQNGIVSVNCTQSMKSISLEKLLNEVSHRKKALANELKISSNSLDSQLTQIAIPLTDDRYTVLLRTAIPSENSRLPPSLSDNDRELIIYNFNNITTCGSSQLNKLKIIDMEGLNKLDLRDNGGGSLECTLTMLAKLLPKGRHKVATINTSIGEEELWVNGELETITKTRKTVFVNKNTASSSEIFAKKLEDNGWILVGGKMMGKRSIQASFKSSFGGYNLTIGYFDI